MITGFPERESDARRSGSIFARFDGVGVGIEDRERVEGVAERERVRLVCAWVSMRRIGGGC